MRKINLSILVVLAWFTAIGSITAQHELKVGNVDIGEVDFLGFNLKKSAEIEIRGKAGSFMNYNGAVLFYGWIIKSDTREVVWNLLDTEDFEEGKIERGTFRFEDNITLDAGDYEVYYTSSHNYSKMSRDLGDVIADLFSSRKRFSRRFVKQLYIEVSGNNNFIPNTGKEVVDELSSKAVVSFIRTKNNKYLKKGFGLSSETELKIYSIGEGVKKNSYDYAWIYDVQKNKRVWSLKAEDSQYAGGADKNILFDDIITLPKGNYMVYYISDDSHSFAGWNMLPPDDPQFWGVNIWTVNEKDMKNVAKYNDKSEVKPIIEITKVGNDQTISKGFSLQSKTEVRILCLGEIGYDKVMADYGWIVSADDNKTVWEMNPRKTEHAGGAAKNRMVDQIVTLDKGNYIVYYTTDDSHSYADWNLTPPYEQDRWGITIWPTEVKKKVKVRYFDPENYKSKSKIVGIVRVGDDKNLSKPFVIKKDLKVRIFALGEGSGNELYDYGWIENSDDGQVVWEMTYRKTKHAGGGSKNRIFEGTIMLSKGNYKLHYQTDDSHSYNDWNVDPPKNKEAYGISLYYDK